MDLRGDTGFTMKYFDLYGNTGFTAKCRMYEEI